MWMFQMKQCTTGKENMQCIEQIGNADNYSVLWGNSELNTCYCISQLLQPGGGRQGQCQNPS